MRTTTIMTSTSGRGKCSIYIDVFIQPSNKVFSRCWLSSRRRRPCQWRICKPSTSSRSKTKNMLSIMVWTWWASVTRVTTILSSACTRSTKASSCLNTILTSSPRRRNLILRVNGWLISSKKKLRTWNLPTWTRTAASSCPWCLRRLQSPTNFLYLKQRSTRSKLRARRLSRSVTKTSTAEYCSLPWEKFHLTPKVLPMVRIWLTGSSTLCRLILRRVIKRAARPTPSPSRRKLCLFLWSSSTTGRTHAQLSQSSQRLTCLTLILSSSCFKM